MVVRSYQLDIYDTIYAVFEDRGVVYNKDKFVNTYFTSRKKVPVYDEIQKINALKK